MGVEYIHYAIPKDNAFKPTAEQLAELVKALHTEHWLCAPGTPAFKRLSFQGMTYYKFAEDSGCFIRDQRRESAATYPMRAEWLQERLSQDFMLCWPIENYEDVADDLRFPLSGRYRLPLSEAMPVEQNTAILSRVKQLFSPKRQAPPAMREVELCDELDSPYYEFKLFVATEYLARYSDLIEPFADTHCQCGQDMYYDLEGASCADFDLRIRVECPQCKTTFDVSNRESTVRDPWNNSVKSVAGGAASCFAVAVDCGKSLNGYDQLNDVALQPDLLKLIQQVFQMPFHEIGDIY